MRQNLPERVYYKHYKNCVLPVDLSGNQQDVLKWDAEMHVASKRRRGW